MSEKAYATLEKFKKEIRKVNSCATETDWAILHGLPLIIEELQNNWRAINKTNKLLAMTYTKQKRKPTEYQVLLGKFMKEGNSIKKAHKLAKIMCRVRKKAGLKTFEGLTK